MLTDLVLSPFAASAGELVEAATVADAGGFDTVWIYDHFSGLVGGAPWSRDPFVTLGAIATSTRRINLGVLVANVVNRHPAQLAAAINSLQSLAPGRVLLGVGAGAAPGSRFATEHEAIGRTLADGATRRALLAETIEALRALWRRDAFAGDHVSVAADMAVTDGAAIPPIIAGASSASTLAVALAHADGVNLLPGARLTALIAQARRQGRPSFEISTFCALDLGHPLGGDPEPLADLGVRRRTLAVTAPLPIRSIGTIGAALLAAQ